MLLHENFLLEVDAVPQFHEFMGVAGITVFAGELATAIRIDCPGERHAHASAAIEQGADGQREVFNFVPLKEGFSLRCQASDADEFGLGIEKKRQGGHGEDSLFVRYHNKLPNWVSQPFSCWRES